MKNIMTWLNESFSPKAQKLFSKPYIAALASAMQASIPFILAGSCIYVYNVVRAYIPSLPDLSIIINFTFRFLSLIVAFLVPYHLMDKLEIDKSKVSAGILGILTFIVFIAPQTPNGTGGEIIFTWGNFGPAGMFVGMCAGLFSGIAFHLMSKLHLLENSQVPDFCVSWINTIIPILIVIFISTFLVYTLGINIYSTIISWFMPLQNFAQTLPGFVLFSFVTVFFFSFGIPSWTWDSIKNPVFMTAIAANAAAVAAGGNPEFINTYETMFAIALITMGGQGATLPLNALMCFSKSKRIKVLGRVAIGPSLFNINEPVIFGAPIVYNPVLMIPFWINGIVGPIIVWTIMKLGWLTIPFTPMRVGQIPAPMAAWVVTQDLRGFLWFAILFVIYLAIWFPFFKIYEKDELKKEAIDAINENNEQMETVIE